GSVSTEKVQAQRCPARQTCELARIGRRRDRPRTARIGEWWRGTRQARGTTPRREERKRGRRTYDVSGSPRPRLSEGANKPGVRQNNRKVTSTLTRTGTGEPLRMAGLNFQVRTDSTAFSSRPRPRGFTTRSSVTLPCASITTQ